MQLLHLSLSSLAAAWDSATLLFLLCFPSPYSVTCGYTISNVRWCYDAPHISWFIPSNSPVLVLLMQSSSWALLLGIALVIGEEISCGKVQKCYHFYCFILVWNTSIVSFWTHSFSLLGCASELKTVGWCHPALSDLSPSQVSSYLHLFLSDCFVASGIEAVPDRHHHATEFSGWRYRSRSGGTSSLQHRSKKICWNCGLIFKINWKYQHPYLLCIETNTLTLNLNWRRL